MSLSFDSVKKLKILLVLAAIVIAAASLIVSHTLTADLKREEQMRMEVWAEAMRSLVRADDGADLNLALRIINANHTIPVIVLDGSGEVIDHRNITPEEEGTAPDYLRAEALRMKQAGRAMTLALAPREATEGHGAASAESITICYDESLMLRRLTAYPYIQLGVVGLFIAIAIYALLSSKRAEQNRVWVGLSRETAHQLGTPISSLMAWTEVLRAAHPDDPLIDDMGADVNRLRLIAERFSKIGSTPELNPKDIAGVIERVVAYMRRRTSDKVKFSTTYPPSALPVPLNAPLFEWVIENLCKNAVDAMSGSGYIYIGVERAGRYCVIEVTDTGKGIAKSHFHTVFRPGYTTKSRGWGLGLSLARRIIEHYHRGRIFVKTSEPGRGTTFRIELPL